MAYYKNNRAFTLMEIITVVIILTIIAAFAIPNYSRAVEKAREKDMIVNMRAIASANEIYRSENGTYWPPVGLQTTAAINSNLRLSIIENKTWYGCMPFLAPNWLCEARYTGNPQFRIQMQASSGWQLYCAGGFTCPTCDAVGCPN